MIQKKNSFFILETKNTTYAFRQMETGHLEHIYYGQRLLLDLEQEMEEIFRPMIEKKEFIPGNAIYYSKDKDKIGLEDLCLEVSSYGKGDIREPFVELIYPDGSITSDFIYQDYKITYGKEKLITLPSSYTEEEEKVISLQIILKDLAHPVKLILTYSVFYDCDVIVRSSKLVNEMKESIDIKRLMSTQLDLDEKGLIFTNFTGAWAREMNRSDHVCLSGLMVNQSMAGISSNRANPFIMLSLDHTTEDYGECYGFNLIYSGNHYEALEVNSFGKSRFVSGINPRGFTMRLDSMEEFEAPEAVMTFSSDGWEELSHHMHEFVREHIVRGEWKHKERPVLLNSWEASYFNFDESKLLKLAKAGKNTGVELFVMDDGWFGKRDNDKSSLGDWYVNTKKLPGGIKGIAEKVNALGLDFGIWVEPEMVNEDSDCYRIHPDWAVGISGQSQSLGRNQMILDLTKKEVREYIIHEMTNVFTGGNISYVKWDMNRIFSDAYSNGLAMERQGEFYHRYIVGLYEVLKTLVERFPHILFEGCASGGNRFDLGMLVYMPQIWASDNTDALSRMEIQQGYSYGYPLNCMGAHVSGVPNHQTLRKTSLTTRFHVACFGLLGIECNLSELSKKEQEKFKELIQMYKEWRKVFQFGDFYRLKDGSVLDSNKNQSGSYHWLCITKEKDRAVLLHYQTKAIPNQVYTKVRTRGLADDKLYHFYNMPKKVSIKDFGDLVNMVSPIRIKNDSLTQHVVSQFIKLDGEQEDYNIIGQNMNRCGIRLKQAFGGTGFNDNVRVQLDNGTRMYFIEEIK